MSSLRRAAAALTIAVLAVPTPAAYAGSRPSGPPSAMVTALSRDLGISQDQARLRLHRQEQAAAIAAGLPSSVRTSAAGMWLDEQSGRLIVAVVNQHLTDQVTAAGALPRLVSRGPGDLRRLTDAVTRLAAPGVTSWGLDPIANQVVVRVNTTEAGAGMARIRAEVERLGPGVRIQEVKSSPAPQRDIQPGSPWFPGAEGNCSVGFPAVDSGGGRHFLTAGHCTNDVNQPAWGSPGQQDRIGTSNVAGTHSVFNREGDMGLVDVTEPSWPLSAAVNTYGGAPIAVSGSTEPLVNQAVCHSGIGSGWQCGKVTAVNQTVVYSSGAIDGLAFTTACSLAGDSGGAWLAGDKAVGLHSGGYSSCSPGGAPDQSLFQPVNEALSKWGLRLFTGTDGGGLRVFSNSTVLPIQDFQPVTSMIQSTASGAAASLVKVDVTAQHTCVEDLDMDLISPSGRRYSLLRYGGSVCHPFPGTKSFSVPTSGEQAAGTWKLSISDGGPGDTGELDRWSITV
ncbi:proprotein convertase P-domain-containing protein [Kribbella sp. NPDC020789]